MTITPPAEAIVYWLKADPALAALVGTRIYQVHLPQSPSYPAVLVQSVSEPVTYHARGPNNLVQTRIQVDSYASEAAGGNQLDVVNQTALLVDLRLSGATFRAGTPPLSVRAVFRSNRLDLYEPEDRLLRIMLEYLVWSRPASGIAA
jgi:Protein of unknown function (DUF3168)